MDAAYLGNAIQDLCRGLSLTQDLEFVNAYIDTGRLGSTNANKLSQVGVSLIHSPVAKEAADKAIILDLLLWLLIFERHHAHMYHSGMGASKPEPCVVLISQDQDFLPLCSKLRNQRGIHVVLVTDFRMAPHHFLNAASETFDWAEVLREAQQLGGVLPSTILPEPVPRRSSRSNSLLLTSPPPVPSALVSGLPHPVPVAHGGVGSTSSFNCSTSPHIAPSGPNLTARSSPVKTLKKRFSSVRAASSRIEDQIADICLTALQSKRKATCDVLLALMKNPAAGGGAEAYQVASQNYGKHLEDVLAQYPDRFELSTNKRSQKTWVSLLPGDHTLLCGPPPSQNSDASSDLALDAANKLAANLSPTVTGSSSAWAMPPGEPSPPLVGPPSPAQGEPAPPPYPGAPSGARLQRQPSDWNVILNRESVGSEDD